MDFTPNSSKQYEVIESVETEIVHLKAALKALVENCPTQDLMVRARAKVSDHGLGGEVRDSDLRTWIQEAKGQSIGIVLPTMCGEEIDSKPDPYAWDDVIMKGALNLLVAAPKVGKSALVCGLIGAWARDAPSYLGKSLAGTCPNVYIVGTDQPESDWFKLFKREGLVDESNRLMEPVQMCWSAGKPLHLTPEGIDYLVEIAKSDPGALFVIDSYRACVRPLGLQEKDAEFDGPARELMEKVAEYGVTTILIHHSKKGSSVNATEASRGNNALPAAASQTVYLDWHRQSAEGQTQDDSRVKIHGQGRAGRALTMVVELKDEGWVLHGEGEEILALERRENAAMALSDKDAEIYAYFLERSEMGFPVVQNELVGHTEFRLKQYQASRVCQRLVRHGLIYQDGKTIPTVNGGRPSPMYFAVGFPCTENPAFNATTALNTPNTYEKEGLMHIKRCMQVKTHTGVNAGEEVHAPPVPPFNHPVEVQLVKGGPWVNGHITCGPAPGNQLFVRLEGSDPDVRKPLPLTRIRSCQPEPFDPSQLDFDELGF